MEELWDYECRIGPGKTTGAWLEVLGTVDGDSNMYVRSRQRTTPWQFTCFVRGLRKAGLEVCDMTRSQTKVEDVPEAEVL